MAKKIKESKEMVMVNNQAEILIAQAIDKGVPVDTMERLLVMRRELKAEHAKEQFHKAMATFQSECPIIKKTKPVYNKDGKTVRYRYAPIDSILNQVKGLIQKYGFSYTIDTVNENEKVKAICTVTHAAGHSQTSSFDLPIDKSAFMNNQQQFASALTFGKRYAFMNAFGILTGDEDNDAKGASDSMDVQKGFDKLMKMIEKMDTVQLEDWKKKIEKSDKYSDEQKFEIICKADERIEILKKPKT